MDNLFNFNNDNISIKEYKKELEQTIQDVNKYFNEVQLNLAVNDYKNIQKLKEEYRFYSTFFEILDKTIKTHEIKSKNIKFLIRGVNNADPKIKHERFIPNRSSINRMNYEDKTYLYMCCSLDNNYNINKLKNICYKEIKGKEKVSFCQFKVKRKYRNFPLLKIEYSNYDPIEMIANNDYRGTCDKINFYKYTSQFFFRLLYKSKAFDNSIQESNFKKYIPFWAITEYLEQKGFIGILFKSSKIRNKSKSDIYNIALFNKKYAIPTGEIDSYNQKPYFIDKFN